MEIKNYFPIKEFLLFSQFIEISCKIAFRLLTPLLQAKDNTIISNGECHLIPGKSNTRFTFVMTNRNNNKNKKIKTDKDSEYLPLYECFCLELFRHSSDICRLRMRIYTNKLFTNKQINTHTHIYIYVYNIYNLYYIAA